MMEEHKSIPFVAHESAMTRLERTIKRLVVLLAISVGLMFLSNAVWLYAWCQYDYESSETTTVTQDGEGANVYGDGNRVDGAENNDKKN